MFRLTPVVKNIIIINVIIFLAQMIAPKQEFASCVSPQYQYGLTKDVVSGNLSMWNVRSDCFKPYQLFTYMFIHGGFMHIFFNMLILAFMGPMLENHWGEKRFILFYLVTGIGAGIFSIFVSYYFGVGSFGTMAGASGAVYGVLMGFGMMFPNMEIQLLIPPIPIKAKYLVVLMFGLTFIMDRDGQVAHFAHLGGVIFAFIMIRAWRHRGDRF